MASSLRARVPATGGRREPPQLPLPEPRAGRIAAITRLQTSAGNRAVAALLHDQITPVQRVEINGKYIPPTGRASGRLWQQVRDMMFNAGYSPHGAKKIFTQLMKADEKWATEKDFLDHFFKLATAEIASSDIQKTLPKEKRERTWTRRLKLARPPWTKEHKKAVLKGEDIRHVVRNKTLRDALRREYDFQMALGPHTALDVFGKMARHLGLSDKAGSAWEFLNALYKAAYLNFGNLFAGAGAINRVIGLTADSIYERGALLITMDDAVEPHEIEALFEEIALHISTQADATEHQANFMEDDVAATFLDAFEEWYDTVTDYLLDVEEELMTRSERMDIGEVTTGGVLRAELGRELMNIGASFGFDLPSDAIGKHAETLVGVEKYLSDYEAGHPEKLVEVLAAFLKVQNILAK